MTAKPPASGAEPGRAPDTEADFEPASLESHRIDAALRRVAAGDGDAAAWLYDRFGERLYRRLKSRYCHPGGLEADDLLHDAFVLFFRDRARLLTTFLERTPPGERSEAALERYLWDQACGLATNRRRGLVRRTHLALEELPEPQAPGDEEARAIDADTLKRMTDCVRGKGERTFVYLALRCWEGLSPEQISTVTGWSIKATYKLKQALNQAVRECARLLGIAVG